MPDWFWEEQTGHDTVAGVDEVGRGCLAGPVVAAALVFPERTAVPLVLTERIQDSKRLSARQRRDLIPELKRYARIGIGISDEDTIERLNIHHATLYAMAQAIQALPMPVAQVLVDGCHPPRVDVPCQSVIKGDSKSLSIAAASIIAKVHRDTLMTRLALKFPHYGWERNAGYGTAEHLAALQHHGVTPHHRRRFAPVAACLNRRESRCVS